MTAEKPTLAQLSDDNQEFQELCEELRMPDPPQFVRLGRAKRTFAPTRELADYSQLFRIEMPQNSSLAIVW